MKNMVKMVKNILEYGIYGISESLMDINS